MNINLLECKRKNRCPNCGKISVCGYLHLNGKHRTMPCSYKCAKEMEARAKRKP